MPELRTPDGRTLDYLEAGSGRLHRTEIESAERLGARLVTYSRPGYAGSSPQPDRSIADAAADAAALTGELAEHMHATIAGGIAPGGRRERGRRGGPPARAGGPPHAVREPDRRNPGLARRAVPMIPAAARR